jgi:hypothetical protein
MKGAHIMDELLIADELMTPEELAVHEQTIERGKQTFVAVGKALRDIRDRKGYRHTHGTFADYVTVRWGFSVSTGYNLIGASEVAENVQALGHSVEYAKAVAISKLAEPEQQAFVEKTDIDTLTSRAVEKAVAEWKRKAQAAERERDEAVDQADSIYQRDKQLLAEVEALRKKKAPDPVVVTQTVEVEPPDYAESIRRKQELAEANIRLQRELDEQKAGAQSDQLIRGLRKALSDQLGSISFHHHAAVMAFRSPKLDGNPEATRMVQAFLVDYQTRFRQQMEDWERTITDMEVGRRDDDGRTNWRTPDGARAVVGLVQSPRK